MSNNKKSYRVSRLRHRGIGNVTSVKDLRRKYSRYSAPDSEKTHGQVAANCRQSPDRLKQAVIINTEDILAFTHRCHSLLLKASADQITKAVIDDAIQSSLTDLSHLLGSEQYLLLPPKTKQNFEPVLSQNSVSMGALNDRLRQEPGSRDGLTYALLKSVKALPDSHLKLGCWTCVNSQSVAESYLLISLARSAEAVNYQSSLSPIQYLDEHFIYLLSLEHTHATGPIERLQSSLANNHQHFPQFDDDLLGLLFGIDCWLMKLDFLLHGFEQQQLLHQLQATAQSVNDGVVLLDEAGVVTSANPAYCNMMNGQQEDLLGRPFRLLDNKRYPPYVAQKIWEEVKEKGAWQGELWNMGLNGNEFLQLVRLTYVHYDETNSVLKGEKQNQRERRFCLAVINDNSRLHEFENQISHLSNYDPLTNLPNRHLLNKHIKSAIMESNDRQTSFALVVVDLDHFKHINDGLGHPIGDRLLAVIAQRLNQELGAAFDIILARLSGDDFVVVLKNYQNLQEVDSIVAIIVENFQHPFDVGIGRSLFITASMGIALYPEHGSEVNQLLSNADLAMYQAKRSGRNQVKYYSHKMTQNVSDLLELTNQLRSALQLDSELQLYYQPQVDLSSRKTTAVEALMRWFHPDLGLIAPGRFIPIAENSGLLPELDRYALQHACTQLQKWQGQGKSNLRIAVNISQQTFVMGGFIELLNDMITRTQIDPTLLELEITEGALLEPSPIVLDTLAGIKSLGVRLAVDDFGTGYSSLAYLHRYRVDKLKIDQSFVQSIEQDNEARVITTSIIQLAAGLGLDVLAEGVETETQLQFLMDNGCNSCQGFIFSRAVPADDLTTATSCLCPLGS